MVRRNVYNGKVLSYKFTPCDEGGWIDSRKFIPDFYDLVFIKVEGRKINLTGWWNGSRWDGVNVDFPAGTELLWKRNMIEVLDR